MVLLPFLLFLLLERSEAESNAPTEAAKAVLLLAIIILINVI